MSGPRPFEKKVASVSLFTKITQLQNRKLQITKEDEKKKKELEKKVPTLNRYINMFPNVTILVFLFNAIIALS